MADPLSIASGITALLQLTGSIIQYLRQVRGASEECRRVMMEVTSVSGFLYMLKDSAERFQSDNVSWTAITSLAVPNGPLDQFKAALEQLASKLAPVEGLKKAGRALAWPFQQGEIKEILTRIERHKSMFALALQNDNL